MSQECLRTGDKAGVHFRFMKHPEYLNTGTRIVFREGRTKAVRNITKLIPFTGVAAAGTKVKPGKTPRGQGGNSENNIPDKGGQGSSSGGTGNRRRRGGKQRSGNSISSESCSE